jgi:hypothetical protein
MEAITMNKPTIYSRPVLSTALRDFQQLSNKLLKPVKDAACSYCGCLSSVSIDGIDSCHCCDDSSPYQERPFNATQHQDFDPDAIRKFVKGSNSHVPNPAMIDEWQKSVISNNEDEALFCAW